MKELLKKLNNFKLTALIEAAAAVFGILVSFGALIAYQFSSAPKAITETGGRTDTTIAFFDNQKAGMMFFLFAIFAIIVGAIVVYRALPYLTAKTKIEPFRGMGWLLLAENVLLLGLMIMIFILLGTEATVIPAVWAIVVALATVSVGFAGMMVYPTLKCRFYTPEVKKN